MKKDTTLYLLGLGHAGMPLIYALQNQGTLVVLGASLDL